VVKLNGTDEDSAPLDVGGGNVRLNWDLGSLPVGEHNIRVSYIKPDLTQSDWTQEYRIAVHYLWFAEPYSVSKKIIQLKRTVFIDPPLDSVEGLTILLEN
jgi:hypothetical protein